MARTAASRNYVGLGISLIGALISCIVLALIIPELEIEFGIDPTQLVFDHRAIALTAIVAAALVRDFLTWIG
jgi:hypothetical protein